MKNLLLFLSLSLFIFSACEKETLQVEESNEIGYNNQEKANDDCVFNDATNIVRVFEHCGTFYAFQGELSITNGGGVHRIQAIAKCNKLGGDPAHLIEVSEFDIFVDGNMNIGCGEEFWVQEPSIYNENLVNGQVPFWENCNHCKKAIVNIDYYKDVTLLPGSLIKAKMRIKMEGCNEWVEENFTVVLEG